MYDKDLWAGDGTLKYLVDQGVNDYSIRQFFEREETINYYRGKIPIGIVRETNDVFYLNMNKSMRACTFAKTGTGKTFFMQTIFSRYFYSGGKVAIPTDVKNEFRWCEKPLQNDFKQFLLRKSTRYDYNELPSGLPIKSYYPAFLEAYNQDADIPKNEMCQMRVENLTAWDFLTLAGITKATEQQRFAVDEVFGHVKKGNIKTLSQAKRIIERSTTIPAASKPLLFNAMRTVTSDMVIGEKYPTPNFVKDIQEGYLPNLNLYGILKSGKNFKHYSSAYVAIILRQLYAAKAEGTIKEPLLIPLEEVRTLCPKDSDSNSSSKEAILDLLRLSRQENIGQIYNFQDVNDAAEVIVKNCNYIFIPRNIKTEDLCDIIKSYAPKNYTNPYYFKSHVMRMKSNMKKFEWLILDVERGEIIATLRPIAPLCYHKPETPS